MHVYIYINTSTSKKINKYIYIHIHIGMTSSKEATAVHRIAFSVVHAFHVFWQVPRREGHVP